MFNIRSFDNGDFEMIASWWTARGELPPLPGMMVEDGTFVLEYDGEPIMSLTVFLTQSRELSYIEGYICRPGVSKEVSHEGGQMLWNHAYWWATTAGSKRVLCYTNKEKLVERYQDLGMTKSPVNQLSCLYREL
jgi:hypothetical protein